MFEIGDVVQIVGAVLLLIAVGYALAQALQAWRRRRARAAWKTARYRALRVGKVIARYDSPLSPDAEDHEEEIA